MATLFRTFQRAMTTVHARGIDVLRNPRTNKGMAMTLYERQILGVQGLLPPAVLTSEQQLLRCMENLKRYTTDLDRYVYLISLQERNEKLFYKVVMENVEYCMPLIYTPTVGLACQKYGLTFRRPRGLYITYHDRKHIDRILENWPERKTKAIVVTDGERILGLGDLGAYGMGIPVGKLSLYTALAGVKPEECLPIMLDVGTNNQDLLSDPLYIGMRHKRIRGKEYDDFVDEFMNAVVRRFGPNTLIQFEDFGNANAFRFLEKYRNHYCTFNDDIQGTAAVAVAGIIASMRITKRTLANNVFLFVGAGEANIGSAHLLMLAMLEEGISKEEALKKIFMVDSKGLVVKNRPQGGLTGHKMQFAKEMAPIENLEEVVRAVKPTALIGASGTPSIFTEKILRFMGECNERPIIFALSNPTSKAECTAEAAYKLTNGRCIFASGSPFGIVKMNGQEFHPGQGNNSYIFPGVALAVTLAGIRPITEETFLKAAQCLAGQVSDKDLAVGRVYPPLSDIRNVSLKIATEVLERAYRAGLASYFPEPKDKRQFVIDGSYFPEYDNFIPETYDYPKDFTP
jgi:malate dehydrogenase (oxaloacetate-decarboxylating)(NADP+)